MFLVSLILPVSVAHADGECNTGYSLGSTDNIAFFSLLPTAAGQCEPGYVPFLTSFDVSYPVARELPMKCDEGYYYKDGNCVAYDVGPCDSGFVDNGTNAGSMFDYTYVGGCTGGMEPFLGRPYAAYVMATAATHCGAGYYPTPNGCVAHATDDCPTNYYAITPSAAFVRGDEDDECATNYSLYHDTDLCLKYLGPNMAEVCTPQLRCESVATTLRTSTGIILPLYREKVTQPSLHVLFDNGDLCYANFISGDANGAVNVNYNGAVYHGVE